MIDLHSHLLPGMDDGSRSVEQSVEVLGQMAGVGIEIVALTPHLKASEIDRFGHDALEQRSEVLEVLRGSAPAVPKLEVGFEILLDQPLPQAALDDRSYALAGSRYYLVEFPLSVATGPAATALSRIAAGGAMPIVAHPERYQACTVASVRGWKDVGALMQVDATTLTRPTTRGRRARELVTAGLADIIAADNHGDGRLVATGKRYLEAHGAERAAQLLAIDNPRAVLEDRDLAPVPPVRLPTGLWKEFVQRIVRR